MAAGTDCYPTWHPTFAPMVGGPADTTILNSGCRPDASGEIRCAPETMRASAEKQLQASSFWPRGKPLDLATYTLGRYMHSEVGSGTVEERVAVGEVAVNRAKLEKLAQGVVSLLLLRQPTKLYGEINVAGGGSTGRFAATSRDPSILSMLLADLVISGKSENINLGADDQDGLEFKRFFPIPMNRILSEANSGRYWVGPIPGVDHWKTTQYRKLGFKPDSFEGKQLIERARQFFGNPVYEGSIVAASMRPVWPANLPICAAPGKPGPVSSGKQFLVGVLLVSGLLGLTFGALRLSKHVAKRHAARALAAKSHQRRLRASPDADFGAASKSKVIVIEGQEWRVERKRHWSPDTGGGQSVSSWDFVRVSDGRRMTASRKDRGIAVITERIRSGVYGLAARHRHMNYEGSWSDDE